LQSWRSGFLPIVALHCDRAIEEANVKITAGVIKVEAACVKDLDRRRQAFPGAAILPIAEFVSTGTMDGPEARGQSLHFPG
jgi:hypothetical protein